jgi:hypothetical protein
MQITAAAEAPQATAANTIVEAEQNFSGWEAEGRWTAKPIRLSLSAKRLLTSQFTSEALRHLASLMEYESPGMVARRRLSESSINALAEMYVAHKTPTIGWWRKHADLGQQ